MNKPLPNTTLKLMLYFARPQQGRLFLFCIFCIIAGLIPSIDGLLFKGLIDAVEHMEKDADVMGSLWPWILYYLIWWETINIHWRIYDYLYLKAFPLIKADVIDKLYNYIQYHSNEFFQENMVGYIANRISETSRSLEMLLSILTEKILLKIAVITASFTAMYYVHTMLATILVIWLGAFSTISIFCAKKATSYAGSYARNLALVTGKVVDAISNIGSIRMFSAHKYERERLENQLNNTAKSEQKMQWYMWKVKYFQGLSCTLLIFSIVYTLCNLRSQNLISIGDFVLVITLCIVIAENVWDLNQEIGDFFQELGIFNQVITIIKPYIIEDKEDASILKINNGTIEFQNVNFRYRKDNELFANKNLIIPGGQKVGLVGFSGSGKSTFVSLISRLHDVTSGRIMIDGQNIKDITIESLRNEISLIPQEPILFHRTIMDNIKYGSEYATDEMTYSAAKKAHIHDEIMKLPEKYNTMCGERGNNLSGGQRQRIIIARAILKNSAILILDEATSALDNITEKLIKNSLDYLMKGRTVLVIAHRLSTLLDMDRILVFNKGKIVEDGSHENLLKEKGVYYKLWQSQVEGFLIDE